MQINLELTNDTSYILDVNELPHAMDEFGQVVDGFTFYPARLSDQFIEQIKKIRIEESDESSSEKDETGTDRTLWSSIHHLIGGGYPHFINTLLFALERGYLDLYAPLMKRPESDWKPHPVTKTYRRTRKWDFYIPVNQRHAHREYRRRVREKNLSGIEEIPDQFIKLFRKTGTREYMKFREEEEWKEVARIDLVKLLLGANYIGEIQIKYIKTMVLKAVNRYSKNQLPSVIIFDNFHAAVAMSLDETGYRVDKIVFSDAKRVSRDTVIDRREKINGIVDNINEVNKRLFIAGLKQHYIQ